MAQPAPNQDLPAWITVILTACAVLILPALAWVRSKLTGGVTRKEFTAYLEKRDKLSDDRHLSNTGLLEDIKDSLGNVRERVSAIEGEMKGRYP